MPNAGPANISITKLVSVYVPLRWPCQHFNNKKLCYRKVTVVDYATCTYTDFHKALQKYPSREIDDFDDILFHIYQGVDETIIVLIYADLTELLQK